MPLAHNWAFEFAFLTAWLGVDEKSALFQPHARDGLVLATAVNDLAASHGEKIPFQSISLESLCAKLLVENLSPHDALSDAVASAEVYRRLVLMLSEFRLRPAHYRTSGPARPTFGWPRLGVPHGNAIGTRMRHESSKPTGKNCPD